MAYDGLPDYEGDVVYETWRRGGNPDRVDRDRVEECYRAGLDSDTAAAREIRHQRPRQEPDYTEQEEI